MKWSYHQTCDYNRSLQHDSSWQIHPHGECDFLRSFRKTVKGFSQKYPFLRISLIFAFWEIIFLIKVSRWLHSTG